MRQHLSPYISVFVALSVIIPAFVTNTASAQVKRRELNLGGKPETVNSSSQRVALVIGNSAYATSPLKNPVNDARSMAQALRDLGFEVIYEENLSQNDMKRAIRSFGQKARSGGIRLFYYAGHGIQVNGENYLIPVNADFNNEQEVEYETVNAGLVLAQMEESENSLNIIILDACRNNPFARSFRSATRGLAAINAPSGSLIAYATAPGLVASDGDGANGLYTQELLRYIRTPGLSVEDVFKQVRISVRGKSQGKQTPWESSSLTGDFYFTGSPGVPKPAVSEPTRLPADASALELSFWDSVKDSSDSDDFKAYLEKYPDGTFASLARRRISALAGNSVKTRPKEDLSTPAGQTVRTDFFSFTVEKCRSSGSVVSCEFVISNEDGDDRSLEINAQDARLVDDQGNEARFSSGGRAATLMVSKVPVRWQYTFKGIGMRATKISLLVLPFTVRDKSYDGVPRLRRRNEVDSKVEFRSVPVANSTLGNF